MADNDEEDCLGEANDNEDVIAIPNQHMCGHVNGTLHNHGHHPNKEDEPDSRSNTTHNRYSNSMLATTMLRLKYILFVNRCPVYEDEHVKESLLKSISVDCTINPVVLHQLKPLILTIALTRSEFVVLVIQNVHLVVLC